MHAYITHGMLSYGCLGKYLEQLLTRPAVSAVSESPGLGEHPCTLLNPISDDLAEDLTTFFFFFSKVLDCWHAKHVSMYVYVTRAWNIPESRSSLARKGRRVFPTIHQYCWTFRSWSQTCSRAPTPSALWSRQAATLEVWTLCSSKFQLAQAVWAWICRCQYACFVDQRACWGLWQCRCTLHCPLRYSWVESALC